MSDVRPYYPDGVKAVHLIEDSGPLVRLADDRVDLDDLMVALAKEYGTYYCGRGFGDEPTVVPGGRTAPEVYVGWYRKQPCNCGDHSWEVAEVSLEDKPLDNRKYGSFLAVYVG